jgi:NADPH-dependent 2,4-dienoyl-CoA reductase/sulfur reductase-like enzyme
MPKPKRILIVGGRCGGASAATRARRLSEDAEVVLFERGPYVSFANSVHLAQPEPRTWIRIVHLLWVAPSDENVEETSNDQDPEADHTREGQD